MFEGQALRLTAVEDGIVELRFDRQKELVNKFDALTFGDFRQALAELAALPGLRGVLVTSAKDVFIAGADIFEFLPVFAQPEPQIAAWIGESCAVFNAFSDLPVPIVTAINGFALGGGLEMALASDFRVIAETAQIGLPETTLGIIPGFGGTARLPRLAGGAVALDWITSGAPRKARVAYEAGVVDTVVAPDALRAEALALLKSAIAGELDWRGRRATAHAGFELDAALVASARAGQARLAAHAPAASIAIELLVESASLTRDAAIQRENLAFARVARTPAAAALVGVFLADQAVRKKARALARTGKPVKRVAVMGAGAMGGGIAYVNALRGFPVVMQDIAQNKLELGLREVDRLLARQVAAGKLSAEKAATVRAAIEPTLDARKVADADIVIEAVNEDLGIKHRLLADIEPRVAPAAVLVSNTATLTIAELDAPLSRPENFAGMHFFNPAPVTPLVEVVQGPRTRAEALGTVVGHGSALGKTPIVVKDSPGFLVNRLLTVHLLAFCRLLRDGVDYARIDRVLEDWGWPTGPAAFCDSLGIDLLRYIVDAVSHAYGSRLLPDQAHALAVLDDAHRLGRKSGAGFWRYETDDAGRERRLPDDATQAALAPALAGSAIVITDEQIAERMILPLVIEAARALDEGLVETAAELDMAVMLGLGFPRFRGGPLRYSDSRGAAGIVASADLHEALGPLYQPGANLREMAAAGTVFFPI
ncbi:3-hydroxyacyl-CoA dehydrogenase NAD-binding domain-containing protein [Derxia lacustris]|uniref:3-hydroxyacyl-CoA dehydrogenase NAD-binding domain-containing protein n=1 Tax=Derxia lacustris TaxID=764842 RepID=UPI000A1703BD|nr:3-hydroxyacyl-CoA dehydrogenase NAD-binding domain-containing protein [Derxia lacustris]